MIRQAIAALALSASFTGLNAAADADEPFIGEIRTFGFNFCPRGWADASGQMLPIAQNQALFSLIGTTYGGDGRTTFALPDLRGRAIIGTGAISSRRAGTGPGRRQGGERVAAGTDTTTTATLSMTTCIALTGIFPSRN